jgi:hypothetical protein
MTSVTRVLLVLTLLGFFIIAAPPPLVNAQEAQFSLAVGQWVTVGQYTLVFRGVTGNLPSYELYIGSTLVAHFPNPFLPPSQTEYSYTNVRVVTTGIAPDGSAVTGIITTQ